MAPSTTNETSRMSREGAPTRTVSIFGLLRLRLPISSTISQLRLHIHLRRDRAGRLQGAAVEVSIDSEYHDGIVDMRSAVEMPIGILRVDLFGAPGRMIDAVLLKGMPLVRQLIA